MSKVRTEWKHICSGFHTKFDCRRTVGKTLFSPKKTRVDRSNYNCKIQTTTGKLNVFHCICMPERAYQSGRWVKVIEVAFERWSYQRIPKALIPKTIHTHCVRIHFGNNDIDERCTLDNPYENGTDNVGHKYNLRCPVKCIIEGMREWTK